MPYKLQMQNKIYPLKRWKTEAQCARHSPKLRALNSDTYIWRFFGDFTNLWFLRATLCFPGQLLIVLHFWDQPALSFAQSDREILKCEDFALGPRGKCLMPLHESENKTSFSQQSPSVKTVSRTIVQRVLPMYQASTAPTCHLHHLTSSLWSLVRWTWSSHYWTWKARHREVMQPL